MKRNVWFPRSFAGWLVLVLAEYVLVQGGFVILNARSSVSVIGAVACFATAIYLVWKCLIQPFTENEKS